MSETRSPRNVRPPRIAPLANIPLFHRVAGETLLVAGGSPGAVWKAELLAAAGAHVRVMAGSEEAAEAFAELAADPPAGRVNVFPRRWSESDLEGVKLAFADLGSEGEVEAFLAAAKARSILVNMVDRTEACDFQVGTIVNRSPVVIAISTDGAAPMLGQSIRSRIEAVLPLGLSAWAQAAASWRPRLKAGLPVFADRRRFWERFTRRAWEKVDQVPTSRDFDQLVEGQATPATGQVILVGAGPGDPELLTLKAVRALQTATTILFDDLVSPEILELARREAMRVAVGKTGHGPSCSQSEICERIVALARAGENVVRLKGGDPLVFGRATEEIQACRDAGVPVSIVPGISAAQGAAAALGISLTERLNARRVQFITGHGADGRLPRDLDWDSIIDRVATTALYMPRRTLSEFVDQAIARGLSHDVPAVAVASATLPHQSHVAGPLRSLPSLAAGLPVGAPVVVLIGEVARDLVGTAHPAQYASAA